MFYSPFKFLRLLKQNLLGLDQTQLKSPLLCLQVSN